LAIGYALSFHPLGEYGRAKAVALLTFTVAAYLSLRRQEPLTAELMHGIRWGLYATLALNLVVIYLSREFFLKQQELGIEALKQSVSTAVLPLIVAVAVCSFIPRTVKPGPVFLGGALLLAGAVLEVFVRGRFHAGMLAVMAAVLVLGPPWRHIFWRVLICTVLAVVAVAVFVNVLPLMGDSFLYLTWVAPESLAGRGPIWTIAWHGFWAQPLGHGFASFAQADLQFSYPHNVLLEVAYELGIFGVLSLLGIYLLTWRRVWQLWLSPPHRMLAAMTLLVFSHMLKSGDISTIAFDWVFLYLLVVCTPLSSSWPLERERSENR
jgi:O-antigen ligase